MVRIFIEARGFENAKIRFTYVVQIAPGAKSKRDEGVTLATKVGI